jgi:hypothetical protein
MQPNMTHAHCGLTVKLFLALWTGFFVRVRPTSMLELTPEINLVCDKFPVLDQSTDASMFSVNAAQL